MKIYIPYDDYISLGNIILKYNVEFGCHKILLKYPKFSIWTDLPSYLERIDRDNLIIKSV